MLPNLLNYPTFSIKIPSLDREVLFRPFTVRDEMVLLISKQAATYNDILRAVQQVIKNTIADQTVNVDAFTTLDLEYVFLKLRAQSVNNIVKLSYHDKEDQKAYGFEVDLNDVEITYFPDNNNKIKVNDGLTILMKQPPTNLPEIIIDPKTDSKTRVLEMIKLCIDKVYGENETFDYRGSSEKEKNDFLMSLTIPVYDEMKLYIETLPTLRHVLSYKNSLGHDQQIVLESLTDFFTWG